MNPNRNHSLSLISSVLREGLKLCDDKLSKAYQFYGCEEGFNNKDTHYCVAHSEKLRTIQGTGNTIRPLKMM